MGATKKRSSGSTGGLEPGTALLLVEAAALADVPIEVIEAQIADGTLLFETQKKGGRDTKIIRLMDLGDVYPAVVGRLPDDEIPRPTPDFAAGSTAGSTAGPKDEAASLQAMESAEAGSGEGGEPVADAVRASGADREALISLCQDMEVRLDLAERERQASTASLLMAQRRVLDLERDVRRRPAVTAAAAAFGLAALVMTFIALRLPSTVRAAAKEEVRLQSEAEATRLDSLSSTLRGEFASSAADLTTALQARGAESRAAIEELGTRLEASLARAAEARAELEARRAQDGDAAKAELARIEETLAEELRGARTSAAQFERLLHAERGAGAEERAAFEARLDDRIDALLEKVAAGLTPAAAGAATKESPVPWWKRAIE